MISKQSKPRFGNQESKSRIYELLGSKVMIPKKSLTQDLRESKTDLLNFGGLKAVTQFTRIIIPTLYFDIAR